MGYAPPTGRMAPFERGRLTDSDPGQWNREGTAERFRSRVGIKRAVPYNRLLGWVGGGGGVDPEAA